MYPEITLAIDNCFAYKRYTRPLDWMLLIRDMGLNQVEASADTECDPLYLGAEYIERWVNDVREASVRTGVNVRNLYSGHGTYATLGLTHTDSGARIHFRDCWIKEQARTAGRLNAGFGFFAHGIDESVLQDRASYAAAMEHLRADLADIAGAARESHAREVSLEQMYSPHQPPWTIDGAAKLVRDIYERGEIMYLTLDIGHMNGQQYFQRPDERYVVELIERMRRGERPRRVWVGCGQAYAVLTAAAHDHSDPRTAAQRILALAEDYPHMFAAPRDGSVTEWLEALACYSPIIHLQQSDGKSSPHWPFTAEYNAKGIIKPEDIFAAIKAAYDAPELPGMPPRCAELVLTLEPFVSTAGNIYDAISDIAESVKYWQEQLHQYQSLPHE